MKIKSFVNNFMKNKIKQIEKNKNVQDNTKISLLKALAMVWVVCSHCKGGGVSLPFENWFPYGLHFMAIFIFTSGYFYKTSQQACFFASVGKKIKAWLLPYFCWNVVYGLISTAFRRLGIIQYGSDITFRTLFITPWLHGHQFLMNVPAWFVPALFTVFVVVLIIRTALEKGEQLLARYKSNLKSESDGSYFLMDIILLIIFSGISCFSVYMCQLGYNQEWFLYVYRSGYLLAFYQLGYFYRKYVEHKIPVNKYLMLFGLVVVRYAMLVVFGEVGMITVWGNFTGNPVALFVQSVLGIAFWTIVADILAPAFEKDRWVKYFAANTFSVMMHHLFVIFGINTLFYIIATRTSHFGDFDQAIYKSTIYYIYNWRDSRIAFFYLIAAIVVPLVFHYLFERIFVICYNKIYSKDERYS